MVVALSPVAIGTHVPEKAVMANHRVHAHALHNEAVEFG